ncbi:MAG: N-glycosylase/DNA lyase [Candidatus Firestonebacteria bacterium]
METIKISEKLLSSPMTVKELLNYYSCVKKQIKGRIKEFEAVYKENDRRLFEELCFCIFTANASAKMGYNCIERIRPILLEGSVAELQAAIKGHYRFWKVRPAYIVHTREFLRENYGLKMKKLIESFESKEALRDFFAKSKGIKGIGYKEASHFLRNIGIKGYGIMDKHILRCLCEFGIICEVKPVNTREKYLDAEAKLKEFGKKIKVDFDELDLLLWSSKTGEILK